MKDKITIPNICSITNQFDLYDLKKGYYLSSGRFAIGLFCVIILCDSNESTLKEATRPISSFHDSHISHCFNMKEDRRINKEYLSNVICVMLDNEGCEVQQIYGGKFKNSVYGGRYVLVHKEGEYRTIPAYEFEGRYYGLLDEYHKFLKNEDNQYKSIENHMLTNKN